MTNIVGNIKLNTLTEFNQGVIPPLKGDELGLCDGRGMFRYKTRVNNTSFLMKQSGIQESLSNTKIPACAGMTAIKLHRINHLEI